jgi:hypothetical protein
MNIEIVKERKTKHKEAKKIYAPAKCYSCKVNIVETLKPNGRFEGWNRVYLKGGYGWQLLCSSCSGKVGIAVPWMTDIFSLEA